MASITSIVLQASKLAPARPYWVIITNILYFDVYTTQLLLILPFLLLLSHQLDLPYYILAWAAPAMNFSGEWILSMRCLPGADFEAVDGRNKMMIPSGSVMHFFTVCWFLALFLVFLLP